MKDRNHSKRVVGPSRRGLLLGSAGLAVSAGVFGFGKLSFAAEEPIKIGVLAPTTDFAGRDNLAGAKLAADEINADGGVLGRQITIFAADEEASPEKAIQAYQTLATRNRVHAVIGGFRSGAVAALLPYIARFKVPMIVTGAASPDLMKPVAENYAVNKYIFRAGTNSDRLAVELATACKDVLLPAGIKRFAIDAENFKWASDYAATLKGKLGEFGAEVVAGLSHDPAITDFTPVFRDAVEANAQCLLVIISNNAGYTLVKQWRDQRVPLHLAGNNNVSYLVSTFYKDTQGACDYEFSAGVPAPLTATTIPTYEKIAKLTGIAPYITALGAYDSVHLVKQAIEKTQSTEPDDIVTGLEEVDYVGAFGRHVFDKSHESKYLTMPIGQWQDGKKVPLWPLDYAQGKYLTPPWVA